MLVVIAVLLAVIAVLDLTLVVHFCRYRGPKP